MSTGKLICSVMLLLLGGFGLCQTSTSNSVEVARGIATTDAEYATVARPAQQAIETVQVGQRVVGRNPIREQVETLTPDPETWNEVRFHMRKPSGSSLWITLLRPGIWLELNDASVGESIDLEIHEMGAAGPAEVTYIGPCPPIPPGDGPVVTGTFKHQVDENDCVLNLWLEGQAEPTGVTDNHPYWSVDRQQFIPAGDLQIGETVDTLDGTAQVTKLEPRAYTGFLNNLETTEHVYRVGPDGALVHNTYARWLKNVGSSADPDNLALVANTVQKRFPRKNLSNQYVDSNGNPLDGQWKAILSIDNEFRIGPSFAGGHHEIAAFATKRGAPSVKTAGSFWFENGKIVKADINSGHFQPEVGAGYAELLDDAARRAGYDGPRVSDSY